MQKRSETYEKLVREHGRGLYRLAHRLCGDPCLAEDLVQECYLEAWRSLPELRSLERARAWLVQILRHRFHRALRARSRRPRVQSLPESLGWVPPERDWALEQALEQLEPHYREPFLLVFMEGYRCREVAELLDLPIGTVLSRIHRARTRLKALLTAFEESGKLRAIRGSSRGAGMGRP
ncbi:MAG: sigma-70 family RNA polymerase sigma factor [Armatimonadetes bacterium]|nr:sigma-70 family RNA polymerase sigma factor [Armatimonadota bacterium]